MGSAAGEGVPGSERRHRVRHIRPPAARRELHVAERRQHVRQMVRQRLILATGLDEITLRLHRVQENHGEAQHGFRIVRVRQTDLRILHIRRAVARAPHQDIARPQRELEVGGFARGALVALLAPGFQLGDGLGALLDPLFEGGEGFA